MKKWKIILLIIIMLSGTIISLTVCHPGKALSSADPWEEYEHAGELIGDGRINAAKEILNKIIRENPGTWVSAQSHFELASIYAAVDRDGKKELQEYQKVVDECKDTPAAFEARANIIDSYYLRKGVPFDTWLSKIDELIVEYGGISVSDILRSRDNPKEDWWEKVHSLAPEYRDTVIAGMYSEIAYRLGDEKRYDDSFAMHIFVLTHFPRYVGIESIASDMAEDIIYLSHLRDRSDFPKDKWPPEIRAIAPRDNQSIGDTRPKIEVELSAGDISQFELDLSRIVFTFDGQDLIDKMRMRIQLNKSGQIGPDFMKVRLMYRPDAPLSPGKHTVYVKAVTHGPPEISTSEKTWSFTVK